MGDSKRVALFIVMKYRILPRRYLILFLCVFLWSCSPASTPTPFIPPTAQAQLIEPAFIITPTQTPSHVQVFTLPTIVPTVDPVSCINNLTFIEDITIPDNSFTAYGEVIDKQWRVENSGTCNWTSEYRLRHTDGASLGAPEEIALYPARSGTQPILQINFTAPFEDVVYESAWQAYDPNGLAFGDLIYIRILVSP
jgi:hypothetical protein